VSPESLGVHPGLQRRYRFFRSLLAANNFILEELTGLERLVHESRSFTLEEVTDRVRRLMARCCAPRHRHGRRVRETRPGRGR